MSCSPEKVQRMTCLHCFSCIFNKHKSGCSLEVSNYIVFVIKQSQQFENCTKCCFASSTNTRFNPDLRINKHSSGSKHHSWGPMNSFFISCPLWARPGFGAVPIFIEYEHSNSISWQTAFRILKDKSRCS